MADTKSALKVFEALSKKIKPLIRELTRSAVRRKKMNIASIDTAAQTVTVYEAANPTDTITIPYRAESGVGQMAAGQSVQVEWIYDDLSTAVAAAPGKGWASLADILDALGIADHIVETGTSGNLTWRKWASGISELWGFYDVTSVPCTTASGALYVTNNINPGVAFPSGVFLNGSAPTVNMTFHSVQGYPAFIWVAASTVVSQGLTPFRLMRQTTATISGRMEYSYKGRWK